MLSVFSLIHSQFADSFRALKRTRTITNAGLLLAIQMVLSSYGVIEVTDSLKISLAHLAIAPTAILFGPVVAGIQGALSDVLGFMLKPTGPYFPGFTLTAALLGIIYGMLLYKTKRTTWQIIAARVIVCLFVNIALNTAMACALAASWAARCSGEACQYLTSCIQGLGTPSAVTMPLPLKL